jgi:hypothetical protein
MYKYKDEKQCEARHKAFQFGTNPMEMSSFEKACVLDEKKERMYARDCFIEGIQGRDGGMWKNQKEQE